MQDTYSYDISREIDKRGYTPTFFRRTEGTFAYDFNSSGELADIYTLAFFMPNGG